MRSGIFMKDNVPRILRRGIFFAVGLKDGKVIDLRMSQH